MLSSPMIIGRPFAGKFLKIILSMPNIPAFKSLQYLTNSGNKAIAFYEGSSPSNKYLLPLPTISIEAVGMKKLFAIFFMLYCAFSIAAQDDSDTIPEGKKEVLFDKHLSAFTAGPYSALITASTNNDSSSESSIMSFRFKWFFGPRTSGTDEEGVYCTLNPFLSVSLLQSSSSRLTAGSLGLSTSIIKFTKGSYVFGIDVPLIEYEEIKLENSYGDSTAGDFLTFIDEPTIALVLGNWGRMQYYNVLDGALTTRVIFYLFEIELHSYPELSIITTFIGLLIGNTL